MKNLKYSYRFCYGFIILLLSMSSFVANADATQASNVQQLAALLKSSFATPDSDLDNNIIDRRVQLTSDELEGLWFYHQLNTGENAKLYRQRIFHLIETETGVRQKTYTPSNTEKWENAWEKPELIQSLSADDIEPSFKSDCDLIWSKIGVRHWRGYVDPKRCKHFSSRRNMDIYIESESIVNQDTLKQSERGFDTEGKQLWGTKPGDYITLNRLK